MLDLEKLLVQVCALKGTNFRRAHLTYFYGGLLVTVVIIPFKNLPGHIQNDR